MKKLILSILFYIILVCLFAVSAWAIDDCGDADATTWCIETTDSVASGATMCDGGACDSSDTIIIDGGVRTVNLTLEDFDGDGSYITITNEDGSRVEIADPSMSAGQALITIDDCFYIDLRGDGISGHAWTAGCETAGCYGILLDKVDNGGFGGIIIKGDSDYIKISYIEYDQSTTQTDGDDENGIQIGTANDTGLKDHSNIEIHHNWFHHTQYSCIYGGKNNAGSLVGDEPYTIDVSLHDNLCTDAGAYGIQLKGIKYNSVNNYIYNNIVKRTAQNCDTVGFACHSGEVDYERYRFGIGFSTEIGTDAGVQIYGNYLEDISGMGMKLRESPSNVYDNEIAGSGQAAGDERG